VETNSEVLDLMASHGGSFVKALAQAWMRADTVNKSKLYAAFPEIYDRYDAMLSKAKEATQHE
jgi:hypothetical protein